MFRKPKDKEETKYLFIGNCGVKSGLPVQELQLRVQNICQGIQVNINIREKLQSNDSDNSIIIFVPSEESTFLFIECTCKQQATYLKQQLENEQSQKHLTIRFAELVQKQEAPTIIEAYRDPDKVKIKGLTLLEKFLSDIEEEEILQELHNQQWQYLARRRVCHFGIQFEYLTRGIGNTAIPFPLKIRGIADRISQQCKNQQLDQLTVNEYQRGIGLAPHIDTHSAFTGAIMSLSLCGGTVMEFRKEGQSRALYLPKRSLMIMDDEARYVWQHYIPHRKYDIVEGNQIMRDEKRISLTFRQARNFPCNCKYPAYCNSQDFKLPKTRMMEKLEQEQLSKGKDDLAESQINSIQDNYSNNMQNDIDSQEIQAKQQYFTPQQDITKDNNDQIQVGKSHFEKSIQDDNSYRSNIQNNIDSSLKWTTIQQNSLLKANTSPNSKDEISFNPSLNQQQMQAQSDLRYRGNENVNEDKKEATSKTSKGDDWLEKQYVRKVYDSIAPHFSATRFAVWPKVREFIMSVQNYGIMADVGCGNGKYFNVRKDLVILGSDVSGALIQQASARITDKVSGVASADVFVADAFNLPFGPQSCDALLCIAVLHHIQNANRRIALLQELARILKPGGRALVTVWATEQEDPAKTINKWIPINLGNESIQQLNNVQSSTQTKSENQDKQDSKLYDNNASKSSNDYFVPWHLPYHRAASFLQQANNHNQLIQQSNDIKESQGQQIKDEQNKDTQRSISENNNINKPQIFNQNQHDVVQQLDFDANQNKDIQHQNVNIDNNAADLRQINQDNQLFELNKEKNTVVFKRYYHLFEQQELIDLVSYIKSVKLISSYYDKSNQCVIFEKLESG